MSKKNKKQPTKLKCRQSKPNSHWLRLERYKFHEQPNCVITSIVTKTHDNNIKETYLAVTHEKEFTTFKITLVDDYIHRLRTWVAYLIKKHENS